MGPVLVWSISGWTKSESRPTKKSRRIFTVILAPGLIDLNLESSTYGSLSLPSTVRRISQFSMFSSWTEDDTNPRIHGRHFNQRYACALYDAVRVFKVLPSFCTILSCRRPTIVENVCLINYRTQWTAVNCGRFCFWRRQSVVFCFSMKYLGNRWTGLGQIHTEDVVFGPSLGRVWRSRLTVNGQGYHGQKWHFFGSSAACVPSMVGKTS